MPLDKKPEKKFEIEEKGDKFVAEHQLSQPMVFHARELTFEAMPHVMKFFDLLKSTEKAADPKSFDAEEVGRLAPLTGEAQGKLEELLRKGSLVKPTALFDPVRKRRLERLREALLDREMSELETEAGFEAAKQAKKKVSFTVKEAGTSFELHLDVSTEQ